MATLVIYLDEEEYWAFVYEGKNLGKDAYERYVESGGESDDIYETIFERDSKYLLEMVDGHEDIILIDDRCWYMKEYKNLEIVQKYYTDACVEFACMDKAAIYKYIQAEWFVESKK